MLMLHKGAYEVNREDLQRFYTPERTDTWTPVPHVDVANEVLRQAESRGLEVIKERWGVMKGGYAKENGERVTLEGARLYGAVDFGPVQGYQTPGGMGMSLGIATSVDKSTAQRFMAGARVFVCDNGVFVGEYQVRYIHGGKFNLGDGVSEAFDQFFHANVDLNQMHESLQARDLNDNDAKSLIVDLAREGAVASRNILQVYDEWQKPAHDDFRPRNAWSLYNCTTEVMKRLSPVRQVEGFRALNRVLAPLASAVQN